MFYQKPGFLVNKTNVVSPSFFGGTYLAVAWFYRALRAMLHKYNTAHANGSMYATIAIEHYARMATTSFKCRLRHAFSPKCIMQWAGSFRCNATLGYSYAPTLHKFAVVSMPTSDHYREREREIGYSLLPNIHHETTRMLLFLYTEFSYTQTTLKAAIIAGWDLCYLHRIPNPPHFQGTKVNKFTNASLFSKLSLWSWAEYKRVVYIDSDMLVVKPIYDLFAIRRPFAASRDYSNEGHLNGGLLSIRPDVSEFVKLMKLMMVVEGYATHCGDQAFLSMIYVRVLPWEFNAQITKCFYDPKNWTIEMATYRIIHYTIIKTLAATAVQK